MPALSAYYSCTHTEATILSYTALAVTSSFLLDSAVKQHELPARCNNRSPRPVWVCCSTWQQARSPWLTVALRNYADYDINTRSKPHLNVSRQHDWCTRGGHRLWRWRAFHPSGCCVLLLGASNASLGSRMRLSSNICTCLCRLELLVTSITAKQRSQPPFAR